MKFLGTLGSAVVGAGLLTNFHGANSASCSRHSLGHKSNNRVVVVLGWVELARVAREVVIGSPVVEVVEVVEVVGDSVGSPSQVAKSPLALGYLPHVSINWLSAKIAKIAIKVCRCILCLLGTFF